jgi:hypothetical protein
LAAVIAATAFACGRGDEPRHTASGSAAMGSAARGSAAMGSAARGSSATGSAARGSASDPASPIPGYRKVGEHRAGDGEKIVEVERITPLPVDTSTGVQHGMALYEAGRYAEAEDTLYPLCIGGNASACGELAYEYSYVSFPHIQQRAAQVMTKACEQHARPIACSLLADAYRDGKFGLPKDAQKARELVKAACADGHYWSCEALKSPR